MISGAVYGMGFNHERDDVEVINSVAYKVDQITKNRLSTTNGNTMNYVIVPKK
ncbi:hypothetical protein [Acetobacterium bakii]|uniref:hypothetical protein n=1 Tax=Acetobacterium bakii TaxID=52689 RepID=UPI001364AA5B|nr:hypothetical protein [Acetobacterium bakii]